MDNLHWIHTKPLAVKDTWLLALPASPAVYSTVSPPCHAEITMIVGVRTSDGASALPCVQGFGGERLQP